MENQYDVVIVGGGPAGIVAAIYAARKQLNTVIITPDLGGQMAITNHIENYPGFENISGPELVNKFRLQVEKLGGKFIFDQVVGIEPVDSIFKVKTSGREFMTRTVVLAFGLTPRGLDVPGEEKFKGRGIAFCATCDAPLYKGKTVAVVGGGNSAMEAITELSKIATKVYATHRGDKFSTADPVEVEKISGYANVEVMLNSEITGFIGDKKLEKILVHNNKNEKPDFELAVDGVFLEIGYVTKTDWLKGFVDIDEKGHVLINEKAETSRPGVYAAGDVTNTTYKQIVISGGEGAKAALSAYKYLNNSKTVTPDW
ncbi:MAG: FAD-dependent oxidoreductase [Patescibacteria group bacterium]|jgi:thioredoxin reductase